VAVDAALSWRAGREAASHKVYLSNDKQAVANGTAPVATTGESRYRSGSLEFGRTYYWKVTEANEARNPQLWEGEVWSFSTIEYATVDDFESYTDKEGSRIYETWIDGMTNGNSGSVVGHLQAPFAEQTIVHGGRQSMPLEYNNVKTPFYSEAERVFKTPQDWTANGADTLALYFRGVAQPSNGPAPLYVVIEDKAGRKTLVVHPDPGATATATWQQWRVPLSGISSAGVNLAVVKKLTLGVGDRASPKPGATGKLYIDDIGVGRPAAGQ
jgi:hypothetical protein